MSILFDREYDDSTLAAAISILRKTTSAYGVDWDRTGLVTLETLLRNAASNKAPACRFVCIRPGGACMSPSVSSRYESYAHIVQVTLSAVSRPRLVMMDVWEVPVDGQPQREKSFSLFDVLSGMNGPQKQKEYGVAYMKDADSPQMGR